MILDNLLTFTGTSNGATGGITSGAQTDSPTTGTQDASNVIDLGLAGLPASISGGGGGGARDIGIGDYPAMKLHVDVTTTFTVGTNMYVELQGAPDNGSGAPGSYTVMYTGPTVVEANLIQGARIADIDVPRPVPAQPMPRFLKLTFVSSGTHSTGAVEAQLVLDRFDQPLGTTEALSGYPAGINIAN